MHSRYDLAGRRTLARFSSTVTPSADCTASNAGIDYCYDAVGRLLYETSYGRRLVFEYDQTSNRTRITHPDSTYIQYTYDALNRVDQVQLNGSASGTSLIADYAYDAMSRRTSLTRGNGVATGYEYTQASRLSELSHDMAGTAHDATWTFGYTDAGQLSSRSLVDVYEWPVNALDEDYEANGLNQYTSVDSAAFNYDSRGNLISDGSRNFTYDYENRLLTASGSVEGELAYDPLGRLRSFEADDVTTEFLYDGDKLIVEYVDDEVVRRYAHGLGVDEPLVWYEGEDTSDARWLVADRQGSIVAATDDTGAAIQVYTYGPYGEPNDWAGARFRYTGHAALPELQLYYYKARVYDPEIGRFLQTDPIGYEDDLNLYVYVRGDPLNLSDPTGRDTQCVEREGSRLCTYRADNYDASMSSLNVTLDNDTANGAIAPENQISVRDSDEAQRTNERLSALRRGADGVFRREAVENATAVVQGDTLRSEGRLRISEDIGAFQHAHPNQGGSIVPGPADDRIPVDNERPSIIYNRGRAAVIEIVDGRFQYRFLRGGVDRPGRGEPSEADAIQSIPIVFLSLH